MNLYVDSSAMVKRHVAEEGSRLARRLTTSAESWAASRVGFVETIAAVRKRAGDETAGRAEAEWLRGVNELALTRSIASRAIALAAEHGLGALDAIHLASALHMSRELVFLTWDETLKSAASAEGLEVLPSD